MSRTSPKSPISRGKQLSKKPQSDCATAVNELVAPFGWKACVFGSQTIGSLTEDQQDLLLSLAQDFEHSRASIRSKRPIPDAFWRVILLPPQVQAAFRSISDAMAFASFITPTTDRLYLWRSLAWRSLAETEFTNSALAEVVIETMLSLPAAAPTPFGAVYQLVDNGVPKVWFGRKAGKENSPALSGDSVLQAVRALFRIGGGS